VGFEKKVPIGDRRRLEELVTEGAVVARRIQLSDDQPPDDWTRRGVERQWAKTNPKRRAALALAAVIQRDSHGANVRIAAGGNIGAICSGDWKLRGFLGADKLGHALDALEAKAKRVIVVLNDTSRTQTLDAIELRNVRQRSRRRTLG
jgi:hypothetical protein